MTLTPQDPTALIAEAERKAFEAWAQPRFGTIHRDHVSGEYTYVFTHTAWNTRASNDALTAAQGRVAELEGHLRALDDCYCEVGDHLTQEDRFRHRKVLIAVRVALRKPSAPAARKPNPEPHESGCWYDQCTLPHCDCDKLTAALPTPPQPDLPPADQELPGTGTLRIINALRENEGASVTLCCDNPDFTGPNNVIEVCDDWTDWEDRRFEGESLFAALLAAFDARSISAIYQRRGHLPTADQTEEGS